MAELRFITVGDPHISATSNAPSNMRLSRVVDFINDAYKKNAIDFAVILGDIADFCADACFQNAKNILGKLTPGIKVFYVCGNHDSYSGCQCTTTELQAVTSFSGYARKACKFHDTFGVWPEQYYQYEKDGKKYNILIFGTVATSSQPYYYFPFDDTGIDHTLTTLVFSHGPGTEGQDKCGVWSNYGGYPYLQGYRSFLNKTTFPGYIGFWAGHTHVDTDMVRGEGIRYITNGSLTDMFSPPFTCEYLHTNFLGYTRINNDDSIDYRFIPYQDKNETLLPFSDPLGSTLLAGFDNIPWNYLIYSVVIVLVLWSLYILFLT